MKKILAIALACVMLFAMVACGNSGEDTTSPTPSQPVESNNADVGNKEQGTIGALLPSMADFTVQMAAGIKRAADESGYLYQEFNYNMDIEQQLDGMETLMRSGVKAYYGIFLNVDSSNEIFAKNPGVGTISQGESVNANAFILDDYSIIANHFIEALDNFRAENEFEGAEVAGLWLPGSEIEDNIDYISKMIIKEIIVKYCEENGLKYVSDLAASSDEEAADCTAQLLNANPNLRYLFCFNNSFAISASNEISSAVADTSGYFVFSSEGDPEGFRLINSGTSPYRACSYNNVELSGYNVGLQLINWIENGEMKNVFVERQLVDRGNANQFLG